MEAAADSQGSAFLLDHQGSSPSPRCGPSSSHRDRVSVRTCTCSHPFAWLHARQHATMLLAVVRPPAALGTTWSAVTDSGCTGVALRIECPQ